MRPRRKGSAAMELALVLPILGTMLMGLFEFSMLFYGRSSVVEACRIGARAAARGAADVEVVEEEVRKVLSPRMQQGLTVELYTAEKSGDPVVVAVSVPMNCAAPDLLWFAGYSLRGRQLYAESRMIKE
jgi:hypothetical protein